MENGEKARDASNPVGKIRGYQTKGHCEREAGKKQEREKMEKEMEMEKQKVFHEGAREYSRLHCESYNG